MILHHCRICYYLAHLFNVFWLPMKKFANIERNRNVETRMSNNREIWNGDRCLEFQFIEARFYRESKPLSSKFCFI